MNRALLQNIARLAVYPKLWGCGVREWINVPPMVHGTPYLSNCPLTDPPLPLPADFSTFSQIWTRADFLHPPARWFCSRGGSGGRQEGHLPPPRKHTPEPKNTPTPTPAATKKNCHTNHTTPTTSSHIRHQIRPALKREYFQVTSRLSATKMSFLTATHLRPILY